MKAMAVKSVLSREKHKTAQISRVLRAQAKNYNGEDAIRPDDLQVFDKKTKLQTGQGGWKKWIPSAFLRCSFSRPATSDIANSMKFKASHSHCRNTRFAAAAMVQDRDVKQSEDLRSHKHLIEIQQVR